MSGSLPFYLPLPSPRLRQLFKWGVFGTNTQEVLLVLSKTLPNNRDKQQPTTAPTNLFERFSKTTTTDKLEFRIMLSEQQSKAISNKMCTKMTSPHVSHILLLSLVGLLASSCLVLPVVSARYLPTRDYQDPQRRQQIKEVLRMVNYSTKLTLSNLTNIVCLFSFPPFQLLDLGDNQARQMTPEGLEMVAAEVQREPVMKLFHYPVHARADNNNNNSNREENSQLVNWRFHSRENSSRELS